MSGCVDLRKRWDNLVGKSEQEAVAAIRRDGKKYSKTKSIVSFYKLGENNIEVVVDDTPESNAAIRSGVVRVIIDQNRRVKYPPLRQN
jgi:hypothetical protein